MSSVGNPFFEACGGTAPLEIEWDDWSTGETTLSRFTRPAVLVGRNPKGDLILDHSEVSKRHAYLQVIEGRLHAIDLESRDGLRWGGVPRRSGWIDQGRPMQLGPTSLRIVGGSGATAEGPVAGPGPMSRRFVSRHVLPDVILEIREGRAEPTRLRMDRVLMLAGSSPLCTIPLPDGEASRFACALVRTPSGIWMVDLLSSRGVQVNGVACRDAWLDDQDQVQVGNQTIRLIYGRPVSVASASTLPATLASPGGGAETSGPVWELIPESLLRQLPDRDGPLPEASSAPFNQALLMLIRLLGEMHRDHLEVVRDEMEQIRRLNQEMNALRAQVAGPAPTTRSGAGASSTSEPTSPALDPSPIDDLLSSRLDPQSVRDIASKRLAAWDKERQSHWRKVMDLLIKT